MPDTLIISRVNFDKLEDQRKTLAMAMWRQEDELGRLTLTRAEADALSGIVNMLDPWSDEQAGCHAIAPKVRVLEIEHLHRKDENNRLFTRHLAFSELSVDELQGDFTGADIAGMLNIDFDPDVDQLDLCEWDCASMPMIRKNQIELLEASQ